VGRGQKGLGNLPYMGKLFSGNSLAGRLEFDRGQAVTSYKHRLLCLFDEFPSLGKLEILQESLAFLAGYGIKCYLICQDLNQLRSRETGYGPDETITSNCHVQNAFQPNRIETADHLSRLTGPTTVVKEQITTSGKRLSAVLTQVSRTYQEVQRNLMNADEIMRVKGPLKDGAGRITEAGDMLIYVAGYPAIYGRQPLYFQDSVFTARAAVPVPDRSDSFSPPETEVRL
jgi:type IV secretion system protein VirD4